MKTTITWKPISELPEPGKDIIATYKFEQFETGFYSSCKEWSDGWCDFSFFDNNKWVFPTHWVYFSEIKTDKE